MSRQLKIFVGLSGGVDSSVAALRLKQAGHDVSSVFIKVWQPDFVECNWEHERLDAMRVAAKLSIPFHTFDAEGVYKKEVVDSMIAAYAKGITPNPDVLCNKEVKFGAFLQFAREHGADAVATGHYAQRKSEGETEYLLRGVDTEKDQSYFLWTLTQEQLQHVYFPIGDTPKVHIRKEAARHELITAGKKDSQGICFLGQVDIREFLRHFVDTEPGDVVDEQSTVVGTHEGALFYTLGQRHGFAITVPTTDRRPYYVTHKDMKKNIVYVSTHKPVFASGTIELHGVNWITQVSEGAPCTVQTRYRQQPVPAHVVAKGKDIATLRIEKELDTPASGQSCVLYDRDVCFGGGVISRVTI